MLEAQWAGMVWPESSEAIKNPDTGVERDLLERVGKASVRIPEGFEIHSKLQRHVKNRLASLESGKGVDWATAEVRARLCSTFTGYRHVEYVVIGYGVRNFAS